MNQNEKLVPATIPELGKIGKPELSHLFLELKIPPISEVMESLELFQSKAELRVLFGALKPELRC